MTEKQINKWLRRRFTSVGWMLVGYYLLMNVMVVGAMALDMVKQTLKNLAVGNFFAEYDMEALVSNGWGYIVAATVFFLILIAWKGSSFWKDQVLAKEKKMTGFTFFSMISFCMGIQLVSNIWLVLLETVLNLMGGSMMDMLESVSGATGSFSMFLYASIMAPISEELIFRGYIMRSLQPYGKRFAILGSAVLFGLFHGNLMQAPCAVLMGLLLGYVAMEYSVFWACVLHMFNNLVLAEGLGRLTGGLPEAVAGVIHITLFGVFFVVSAVILVKNRHQITAYRRGEWIDRRCVKCLFASGGVIVLTLLMLGNMITMFLL